MEQFLYGLLTGVALGMWLAILLYTFAGKRRQRLTLRHRQARDAQLPAHQRDGRPADDFDDYYEQQGADDEPAPAEPESAPVPSNDGEQAPVDVDEEANDDAEADDEVYRRLIDEMDGDTAAAERLIDYERERTPAAPRAALIQNALDRLEYDPR